MDSLQALREKYQAIQAMNLNLNMQRGQPSDADFDLSNPMLTVLTEEELVTPSGVALRNYPGGQTGLLEARELFATVPLARRIFRAPTRFYKAGIAFLAWLNGFQNHFIMPAGFQSSRDNVHYAEVFRLADTAGLLALHELAIKRMRLLTEMHGIG